MFLNDSVSLAYRGVESGASCDEFGAYAAISADCTVLYDVKTNGSAGLPIAQFEYDARDEPWYSAASERGSASWSAPHLSSISGDRLITHSMPGYDPDTGLWHSVSYASIRLSYCKCIIIMSLQYFTWS